MWTCIDLIRAHQAERLRAFPSASMFTKCFMVVPSNCFINRGEKGSSNEHESFKLLVQSPMEVGQGRRAGKASLVRTPPARFEVFVDNLGGTFAGLGIKPCSKC